MSCVAVQGAGSETVSTSVSVSMLESQFIVDPPTSLSLSLGGGVSSPVVQRFLLCLERIHDTALQAYR
ncbi:hypothetical protein HJC23_008187 [Cyclotella cryptica]|uniref:Uncharacterized protein n=1 Tax=Cyclotella cryptica TaxID=29204 RepID=A0ABD3PH21_9STRA